MRLCGAMRGVHCATRCEGGGASEAGRAVYMCAVPDAGGRAVDGRRREELAPVAGGCFKEDGDKVRIWVETTFSLGRYIHYYERFGVSDERGANVWR